MNLIQFLATLRARFWLAALVFVATVGAATATALLMPKVYTASASLIVDTTRPDALTGQNYGGNPSPALLATQIGVLKSERVAQDVVQSLKLIEQPELHAKWLEATQGQGQLDTWLTENLLKSVTVTPARDSNVVTIEAQDSDPVQAANVANAFVQSYLRISLKLRVVAPAQQESSFFETQAKDLRAKVEHAQQRLSAFQHDRGVIVSDDRLDTELSRMNELAARLVQLQGDATSYRPALASLGDADPVLDLASHPALAGLRSDLAHAESQLQDLNARLGLKHPQVVQARAQVATLREKLDAEQQRVSAGLGAVHAVQRERLDDVRNALEAQRARVLRLRAAREEGTVLLRDVETAQRAFDAIQGRLSQSTLESHATQSNAYLLTEATPPIKPTSPRMRVNVGLAAVLGLLLAMGAVLLLEMTDPRLRTNDAAHALLGQPLLGVLPRPGVKGDFAARRVPLVAAIGLGRLAGPKG
ncbi:MAG: chain length determinant protein EpsF [Leptothrix sp. (in: b-proteobacteria)]